MCWPSGCTTDSFWPVATTRGKRKKLSELREQFPPLTSTTRILESASPNTAEVEQFLREAKPDIVIVRCKSLLKESIFSIASRGTFVMHPGICPQYRNAHGCFWAMAKDDRDHVGMTLLKIDKGIDTGPVYGYYHCEFDEVTDSHHVIQHKVVFDNLKLLRTKFAEIYAEQAKPLDTNGLPSGEWGQPWLTAYFRYLRRARRAHLGARSS